MKPKAQIFLAKLKPDTCHIQEGDTQREVGRRKAQQYLFECVVAGDVVDAEQVTFEGLRFTVISIFAAETVEHLWAEKES